MIDFCCTDYCNSLYKMHGMYLSVHENVFLFVLFVTNFDTKVCNISNSCADKLLWKLIVCHATLY